jgi:aspartokinase
VPVLLISQSSSQNDICFVVSSADGKRTVEALRAQFSQDLMHQKVDHVTIDSNISIVAVVGENMRGTVGISGRTFSVLGRENVNIIAIAQGSSETNISFVVARSDMKKALTAVHDEFALDSRTVSETTPVAQ